MSTNPEISPSADLTYLRNNFANITKAGRFPALLGIEGLKDVNESARQAYLSSQDLILLNLTNNLVIKELDFNDSLNSAELSIDLGSLARNRLNSKNIPQIISSSKLKKSLVLSLKHFKKTKVYTLNSNGTYTKIPKKDLVIIKKKIKIKENSIPPEALYLMVVGAYGNDFIKLK